MLGDDFKDVDPVVYGGIPLLCMFLGPGFPIKVDPKQAPAHRGSCPFKPELETANKGKAPDSFRSWQELEKGSERQR